MLVSLRPDNTGAFLITAAAVTFLFGLKVFDGLSVWAIGPTALIGLIGWLRSIHHSRLILDTPTSRVASAAQGYTELFGHGEPLDGTPLLSPINGLPVLWYRLIVEEREGEKWVRKTDTQSDASFLLYDGTGTCAVDPTGAEMLVHRKDVEVRGDTRYTQWSFIKHDPIYVIGEFGTLGSIDPAHDTAAQVRELLAYWKEDKAALLARFDANGDGEIDVDEWEQARAEAKREVRQQQMELSAAAEAHIMRHPGDRRLYLISDLDPTQLGKRYQLWGWIFLAVTLLAIALIIQQLSG